jgi:hypothetical protein
MCKNMEIKMANNNKEFQDKDDLPDDLGDLLRIYARYDVPDDFLAGAQNRFEAAGGTRLQKRAWMALGVGLGGIISVAAPILWMAIFNFTFISKIFAAVSRISLLLLNSIINMWYQLPEVSFGILIALWVTLFGCAVMLLKTFRHVAVSEPSIPTVPAGYEHNVPL